MLRISPVGVDIVPFRKKKVKGSVYEKFLKLSDRERSDLGKVRKLFIDTP